MLEKQQNLDKQYQDSVPYLGQEHIIQKGLRAKKWTRFN